MDAQIMKPRVLVLTKLFWPEGGGAELETYLIAKNVLSKHFNVVIVSGTRKPELDVLKVASYIHWSVLESKYKPIEWLKLFVNTQWFRKLVKKTEVVYIPSHTLIPLAIITKLVKPNVKVILHLHNYQVLTFTSVVLANREPNMATDIIVEYGEHRNLLRAILAGFGHYMNYLNRLALNYVDEVICVSKRQCEIILKYLPELRNRAIVIYNLPPSLSSIGKRISKEPTLVYASGGSYIKGFNMFLEMLTRVLKRHECKIYVTYGRKTSSLERSLLDKLSQKLNSKLIVLGRLPYKEYLKLHEHVWSLLFPSIYEEPLPYAVVESMLMGTMPVAARVGGVPEIVGGSPAEEYLFTTGDVDEFVDKIEMLLLQSRDNIMDVGIRLRKHALKLFNKEEIENKIVNLFESILSQSNAK